MQKYKKMRHSLYIERVNVLQFPRKIKLFEAKIKALLSLNLCFMCSNQ